MRSKENFLVFGSPDIGQPEIDEVVASMKAGWLGTGPKVARFEADMMAYKGISNAIALNSCTAALHLAMIAVGIEPGDEVITTPLTFCATVNAIIHAGGVPVLADVDPFTMNISIKEVEAKITSKTRAIVPVHFGGRSCEMFLLREIVKKYRLKMVEDCAHAIETEYHGQKAGSFGDLSAFSFYVTKNVVTGEGGMILTDNEEYACRLKVLALHGMSCDAWRRFSDEGYRHYLVTEAGYKYNMMDIQAAIGIHQLARVEENWNRRQQIWQIYNKALADTSLILPAAEEPDTRHAYHLYTILIDEEKTGVSRDEFLNRMNQKNIGTGVHYLSIPEHPYYQQRFGWKPQDTPNAMRIGRQTVSLPISAKLDDEDIYDVISAVTDIIN